MVEIFTKNNCRYCVLAKEFFKKNNIIYAEINIEQDDNMALFKQKCGANVRTVPQIFKDDEHIGGYDDMMKVRHKFESVIIEQIQL